MSHIRLGLVVLLLALSLMSLFPAPALAIADPDSPPSVNAVYVYNNVLESGDTGILIDYFLDYAALPTKTATESYLGVFVDTDGTTQLKAVAPYAYVGSGYGRGLIWIYFTAAEVTTYSIDSVDSALYRVWLVGNPTLAWVPGPNPPKTVALIDQWNTVSDPSTLIGLRVLYYADVLELAWSLDLYSATSQGNRLTTAGEQYFENVIANLRTIAPWVFTASTITPANANLDYSTQLRAVMTNGTGAVTGSPITFGGGSIANGTGTVTGSPLTFGTGVVTPTVTVAGTFTVTLPTGNSGTAESEGWTVTGSPVVLAAGANTVTVQAGGSGTIVLRINGGATTWSSQVDVTGNGTFTIVLAKGTRGTMTNGTGTVTGSPVALVAGTNTVTTTGIGTFTMAFTLPTPQTALEDSVLGTGFDLTTTAANFGMSRWVFSGLVWFALAVVTCAAVYRSYTKSPSYDPGSGGAGKTIMLIFDLMIIAGVLLGLLHMVVAILMFIIFTGIIGYVLFFRGSGA